MSVSLDDIWSEPLANEPSPLAARPNYSAHRIDDDDDEENAFRPTKRRRSTLFLEGSDDENEEVQRKSPVQKDQSRPDIDALFENLEEPSDQRASRSSKPFDLAALRRDARARAEKETTSSSFPQYAVQSSSPPRDGLHEDGKDGPFASRTEDASGIDKRRQMPKLNEDRLLGKDGLPALVQACRDFKPKGKGHELADLNRLFSLYQFWAHKMYPKTQFSDTVNRIEKVCHSKRMHSALLGWRDDFHGTINGKKISQDMDIDMHSDNGDKSGDEERRNRVEEDVFGPRQENTFSSSQSGSSRASSEAPDPPVSRPPSSVSGSGGDVAMEDDDPFDVDALLRQEEEMRHETAANTQPAAAFKAKGGSAGRDFMFDEDEEAIWAELHDKAFKDDLVPASASGPTGSSTNPSTGTSQSSKLSSTSTTSWDDDSWDVLDEMEREQHQTSGAANDSNDSSIGTESVASLPTPSIENKSTFEAAPTTVTPTKTTSTNDDDWDDMYV